MLLAAGIRNTNGHANIRGVLQWEDIAVVLVCSFERRGVLIERWRVSVHCIREENTALEVSPVDQYY